MPERGDPPRGCLECRTELQGIHCHVRGQRNRGARLHERDIVRDVADAPFSADSSVWRTVVGLTPRPGRTALACVNGQRTQNADPLEYFVLSGAVTLVLASLSQGSFGVSFLGLAFRAKRLRDAEHLVLALHVQAHVMLVGVPLVLSSVALSGVTPWSARPPGSSPCSARRPTRSGRVASPTASDRSRCRDASLSWRRAASR